MSPDELFYGGIVICAITIFSSMIAIISFHFMKINLNKKLDMDYGKRRN